MILNLRPRSSEGAMTRPCGRRKLKNPRCKVKRRQAKPKVKNVTYLAEQWKPHATLDQNYSQIGLMHHLNADLHGRGLNEQVQVWLEQRQEQETKEGVLDDGVFTPLPAVGDMSLLFKPLTACSAPVTIEAKKKRLSADQRAMMSKLVAKYGEDYERMAMDHRLNPLQHSAGKLAQLASAL